jgi:hypothetical protein
MSFPKVLRGKSWKFGVNIDTDQIIPAKRRRGGRPPLRRPPLAAARRIDEPIGGGRPAKPGDAETMQ